MFDQLTAPGYAPFTVAFGILVAIVVIEIITVIAGSSAAHMFEGLFDGHGDADGFGHADHDVTGNWLEWINVGRAPLLLLIAAALGLFAAAGYVVQGIAGSIVATLPGWLASIPAIAVTIPSTRWISRMLGRYLPREETYVTQESDLIGRTGIVTVGPVRRGVIARMKLQDQFGNWHFPKIEPFAEEDEIGEGVLVLVVEQRDGVLRVAKAEGKLAEA